MKTVPTFEEFLNESISAENKGGDCYVFSYNYIMSNPNAILVHGLVTGQGALDGIVYNHAWCEEGNKIVDMTLNPKVQKTLPTQVYYAIGNIQTTYRYTIDDVMSKIDEYGTYGPWETKLLKNKY